ncbi:MAG: ABC transporter permease [Kangiellaceae bacterium]|nr:ABC transporter permease [Kangiellaceae bacterium]
MFLYYVRISLHSIKRNPLLSSLMIIAIALGIGVSMTTITVYHLMSADPIPDKSQQLFAVQLDSWGKERPFDQDRPERAPHQLTHRDATALIAAKQANRQVAMFESTLIVEPEKEKPFISLLRVTTGDFFPMFEVPFLFGNGWTEDEEQRAAKVVVLSKQSNQRLFGGENSVGKTLRLGEKDFKVIGVLDNWNPTPRFYDVINGGFNEVADMMIPFSLTEPLELNSAGSDWGWKAEEINSFKDWLNSESAWIQFWVEIDQQSKREQYLSFLDSYVMEQKKLGRFERSVNNHLQNVPQWMAHNEVVQEDNKVLVGLSILFLFVCMLSAIALLLTHFLGKSGEVALRRALGANRKAIFGQHLIEVSMTGILGGLLGILFSLAGLQAVRLLYANQGFDHLVQLDIFLVSLTIILAWCANVLAGFYPAWKLCQESPAGFLKTQ